MLKKEFFISTMLKHDSQKKKNIVVSTFKVERPSRVMEISISRTLRSATEV